MEGLRDIKDIVEVQEYSFEILLSTALFSLILLFLIIYLLKNRGKKRKKLTQKEIALRDLQNINYKNTKEIVYTFSQNAHYFLTQENKKEFEIIEKKIEKYKYKRDIPKMQGEKELIQKFIKGIKWVK